MTCHSLHAIHYMPHAIEWHVMTVMLKSSKKIKLTYIIISRDPKSNINPYPNNKKQKSDYNTLTNKQKHALIISGQVTLDSLQIGKGLEHSEEGDYDDVIGYFCQFDWSLHKRDPSKCKYECL